MKAIYSPEDRAAKKAVDRYNSRHLNVAIFVVLMACVIIIAMSITHMHYNVPLADLPQTFFKWILATVTIRIVVELLVRRRLNKLKASRQVVVLDETQVDEYERLFHEGMSRQDLFQYYLTPMQR